MGGGGQSNSGQASTAAAQQSQANTQDMAISKQNADLQKQLSTSLFGNGTPGSSGSLTGMMNPANLNTPGLNQNYTTQFNEGKNQIGQSTAQQRGQLAQSFANSGATSSSTPSGFQADQMRQLGSGQADAQGQLYAGLKGQQYSDALNNFWNANNIASGNAASSGNTATGAAGNSGSSSASIYNTAGAYHPSTMGNVLGSAIGAGGAMGSAGIAAAASNPNCPADGSMILMADNTLKKVEELKAGDRVLGMDRRGDEVIDVYPTSQAVCTIFTKSKNVTVSQSHTFVRHDGGYCFALKARGEILDIEEGSEAVIEVRQVEVNVVCRHIMLKRSHGYCCDGFWSLE